MTKMNAAHDSDSINDVFSPKKHYFDRLVYDWLSPANIRSLRHRTTTSPKWKKMYVIIAIKHISARDWTRGILRVRQM